MIKGSVGDKETGRLDVRQNLGQEIPKAAYVLLSDVWRGYLERLDDLEIRIKASIQATSNSKNLFALKVSCQWREWYLMRSRMNA